MPASTDQAKTIFLAALEISKGQRKAFIQEECGSNDAIRREVERLLTHHGDLGSFLESSPPGIDTTPTDDYRAFEEPGHQLGPYKLRERVGAGGMGVVWVAEQKQPLRRKVALKVIKPGMDSQAVVARFEAEREALSLMDHPNIARVLDAGTTDQGRPYFVMELIRGMPITEYCDQGRLTVRQRLELFIQVCNAVQHAHQKGIIHRDIKPSNVLVTEHDGIPLPKVIDFGVAKALHQPLTERSIYTSMHQVIGTLAYMSPEQAALSARDVDTRADIYGLGVLLYELLTGETPFDRKRLEDAAFDEACRVIREQDPPKPSTKISTLGGRATAISVGRGTDTTALGKIIRGDLDWIAMKSLEKDRSRRYETAAAFGADVRHYLDDELVDARPPSAVYRLRKFVRKHRIEFAVSSLLLTSILLGLAGMSWLASELKFERDNANALATDLAEQRDQLARALTRLSESLFDQGMSDVLSGRYDAAREQVRGLQAIGASDSAAKLEAYWVITSGDSEQAIQMLIPAVERDPESIGYRSLLAIAHDHSFDFAGSFDQQSVLDTMPSETYEDKLFEALRPRYFALDPYVRLRELEKLMESRRLPAILMKVAMMKAHIAIRAGDVQLAEESLQQVALVKEWLGLANGEVRALCLKTGLDAANALGAAHGPDAWTQQLKDVEDVVRAIEKADAPTALEQLYLGYYYKQIGRGQEAFRRYLTWDLALAVELGVDAAPENLAKTEQRFGRHAIVIRTMYLLLNGRRQEAREACADPQSLGEVANQVLFLLACGEMREAKTVADDGFARYRDEPSNFYAAFFKEVLLPSIANDWEPEETLNEARKLTLPQAACSEAHFLLGVKHYGQGDRETARSHFQSCIDLRVYQNHGHFWSRAFLHELNREEADAEEPSAQ